MAVVWTLNLDFNFMDGIDGIAASEAAFILLAAAGLSFYFGNPTPQELAPGLIAAAASLGFLRWNWPTARIFMGDIGCGYLGYVIAVLGLESSRASVVNVYAWIILGGLFLIDATVTLCRRLLRGERAHQPHRTHAYQWLARRWGSHAKATTAVIAVRSFWLYAGCARLRGEFSAVCLLDLHCCAYAAGRRRPTERCRARRITRCRPGKCTRKAVPALGCVDLAAPTLQFGRPHGCLMPAPLMH